MCYSQAVYFLKCVLLLPFVTKNYFSFMRLLIQYTAYPVDFSMGLQTLYKLLATSESSHVGPDTTTPTAEQDIVDVQA